MEATGIESWKKIQPMHVTRRVALGKSKSYEEIWEHLKVPKGGLLEGIGPDSLLQVWKNSDVVSQAASI